MDDMLNSFIELLLGVGPLLPGLIGAFIGSTFTYLFNRRRDHLELKREVLRRVMGYRWQLATMESYSDDCSFFTSLNEIPVIFAGDYKVEKAFEKFRTSPKAGRELIPLIQAMVIACKIKTQKWPEELLMIPMSPPHRVTK